MEKLKNIIKDNFLFLLLSVVLIYTISMPLLQEKLTCADDYQYHMARIQSITDSIKIKIFPVKIHFEMANGFGYGSGLFYPNLFLYIPSIINLITNNLAFSYKIFIITVLSLLYIFNYYSIKSVTKNSKTALLATSLIFLSKCLALNLYDRSALGEFLGFLFIAPIVCGLYNYVHDNFDKPYILAIGFIGVVNSHLITTYVCLIFALVYFIINIRTSINNPKKFIKLLVVAVLVILLCSAFWIPFIEQLSVQKYKFSEPWTKIENDEFSSLDLFGTGRYSIGLIFTIATPILFYSLFEKDIEKSKKLIILLALILTFIMIFSPFWHLTKFFLNTIQFKWRLLGLTTILDSLCISILVEYYSKKYNLSFKQYFINIVLFAFVLSLINISSIVDQHDLYTNEYLNEILFAGERQLGGGQEYLPIETDFSDNLIEPDMAIANTTKKILFKKSGLSGTCPIDATIKSIDIPYIYYLGYSAYIIQDNGDVEAINVEKNNAGLIHLNIPDNISGTLVVYYNGTRIQKISYIISLMTLLRIRFWVMYN